MARNAVFSLIGRITYLIAWALVTPYMLRVLGEQRFAIWALFFALSGYYITFDFGLSQALVKFVAQFAANRDMPAMRAIVTLGTLLYAALTLLIVVGLAVWQQPILGALSVPTALRAEAGWCLVAMGIVLGAANLVGVMTAVITGHQRMDVTNRITLIVTFIQVAGAVAVLALGWGLKGLVLNAGLAMLITGMLSWRAVRQLEPDLHLDFSSVSLAMLRQLAHFGGALQISNLGYFLQFQLDKVLLAHFVSLSFVTHFELAFRLSSSVWALPLLPLAPLVPAVAVLSSLADRDRILRLYRRASRYLYAVAFPIAAFVIVTAPALVTAWLGPGFPQVAFATAWMTFFLLVTVLTAVGNLMFRGMGTPWNEARYYVVGTLAHLVLSLWLVPRFGLNGALVSVIVSGVVSVAYFVVSFHPRIGDPIGRWAAETLAVPSGLSLAAGLLCLLWRGGQWNTMPDGRAEAWLQIAQAAAVFTVVIGLGYALTRYITVQEIRDFKRGVLVAPGA